MAKAKAECRIEDTSRYDKLIEFLKAPDDVNELNEQSPARDYSQWVYVGRGYAKIYTSGSRQFLGAAQIHEYLDAVVETPWTRVAATVKGGQLIKYTQKNMEPVYYAILAVTNVNEDNVKLRFICRKSEAQQNQVN